MVPALAATMLVERFEEPEEYLVEVLEALCRLCLVPEAVYWY